MSQLKTISTSEARKGLPAILRMAKKSGEIFIITSHGKAEGVIANYETMERYLDFIEFKMNEKEILESLKGPLYSLKDLSKYV